MRFDLYLVQNGFYESRNKAASAIKEGLFKVNDKVITKPAYDIVEADVVIKHIEKNSYVARSAYKLLTAFERFDLRWDDRVVADLGASTGGFCQVLLEKNVRKIYAVDIGTAQLHPLLLNNPKIINCEHKNARYLLPSDFNDVIDVVTADLSFISIKAVLPAINEILSSKGEAILLVKPQFEVGAQKLSKSGVVNDRKDQYRALVEIAEFAQNIGFAIKGISFSGLAGESGNREYLLYVAKGEQTTIDILAASNKAVYMEETNE